jgi:hypothetical protein
MEMDITLYNRCSTENGEKTRLKEAEREASNIKWQQITNSATAQGYKLSELL